MSRIVLSFYSILAVVMADDIRTFHYIKGGEPTSLGEYPYHAMLRDKKREDFSHFCSGAIINERWILTAAQCINGCSDQEITVAVATNVLSTGGDVHDVSKTVVHPLFSDDGTWRNDIALIQTATPIVFNENAQAILLETSHVDADVEAVVTGSGVFGTSGAGIQRKEILSLNRKTINNEECQSRYDHFGDEFFCMLSDEKLCVFDHDSGHSSHKPCGGDLGSPLVADGKVIGISSWGSWCSEDFPDVYTRVSFFKDWIDEQVGKQVEEKNERS